MRTLNGQPAPWIKDLSWLHKDIYFADAQTGYTASRRPSPDTFYALRKVNGQIELEVFDTNDLRQLGILKAAKDMVDADGKSIADKDFINDTRVQALLKSQGYLQTLADLMTSRDDNIQHTCFAAGTLVHTERGLVPIEQLRVGDKVLSKAADDSGELVYKAISKTMVTERVPVFLMEFDHYIDPNLPIKERFKLRRALDHQAAPSPLLVTANHPFWTLNQGWVKAEKLTTQDIMTTQGNQQFTTLGGGGFNYKYKGITPLFKTNKSGFGYIVDYSDETGRSGGRFIDLLTGERDYSDPAYRPIIDKLWINDHEWKQHLLDQTPEEHREHAEFYGFRQGNWRDPDTVEWGEGEGPLTMTVYNIEVEDTHTYFVGEAGIWVHNCGGEETFSNSLTIEQIQTLLPAAMQYWINAGVSEQELSEKLSEYRIEIQTLVNDVAAVTNYQAKRITFSPDASGLGWFVDATPMDSIEFTMLGEDFGRANGQVG